MNGVYGDMLLHFPEQKRTITVYSMTPKVNGGWTVNNDQQSVRGIWQHTSPKQLKDSNGNLVESAGLEFWSNTGGLNGLFTQLDNAVYRLNSIQPWPFEGGFFRYNLTKVVGNNGTESDESTWNTGTNSFC